MLMLNYQLQHNPLRMAFLVFLATSSRARRQCEIIPTSHSPTYGAFSTAFFAARCPYHEIRSIYLDAFPISQTRCCEVPLDHPAPEDHKNDSKGSQARSNILSNSSLAPIDMKEPEWKNYSYTAMIHGPYNPWRPLTPDLFSANPEISAISIPQTHESNLWECCHCRAHVRLEKEFCEMCEHEQCQWCVLWV